MAGNTAGKLTIHVDPPRLGCKQPVVDRSIAAGATEAIKLGRAGKAKSTRDLYAYDWKRFDAWCAHNDAASCPARPETIGSYIGAMLKGPAGLNPRTFDHIIAAIAYYHRLHNQPFDRKHAAIAEILAGARRAKNSPLRQARPLTAKNLKRLLAFCNETLPGLRARALLLLGFFGALRRSELVGVEVEHLEETEEGYNLLLPHSKTDQEGEGAWLGIPRDKNTKLCPVAALKFWLEKAKIDSGPVFRPINRHGKIEEWPLSARSVNTILKDLAKRAGLDEADVLRISGHSLRAGHITTAYEKKIPEHAIQRQSRHQDVKTLRRYNRVAGRFTQTSAPGLLDEVTS